MAEALKIAAISRFKTAQTLGCAIVLCSDNMPQNEEEGMRVST